MKRTLLILAAMLALAGCNPGYQEVDDSYRVRPDHLKDCQITRLDGSNGGYIYVVRCPNSTTSTTYKVGKSHQSTVTIDGDTYVKEEK